LLERLGADGSRIRFHRLGWRALHWFQLYERLFGWRGHLLFTSAWVAALTVGTSLRSVLAIGVAAIACAGQATALLDDLLAEVAGASGRPRLTLAARLLRFLWRRLPAPRRRGRRPNTVEVLFWRGRFRWRGSHRTAVVQDMTPRNHPELHTAGNVLEFEEYLGYVQRHAQTVLTVSEHSRRDIINLTTVSPDCVRVIGMPLHPQYVDPRFSEAVVASHDLVGRYVLCVGTIEPRKNLRRLLMAFDRLRNERAVRDVALVLAGPQGWDRGFRDFLLATNAGARVRLLGAVPTEHLPSLYHFASAVIYPSVYEGFGLPVLEAMCSGAVVLASRASSLPEVLGEDGLLFDPLDTEDIERVLLHALTLSPTDAAGYRSQCRQRAKAHLERLDREDPLAGRCGGAPAESS